MQEFEQKVMELKVYGFTVVDEVLDAGEVAELENFVVAREAAIGVESSHRGSARHLANLVGLSPLFFPLIDHPGVLPFVEAIMGRNLILGSLNARVLPGWCPAVTRATCRSRRRALWCATSCRWRCRRAA
jgi:hypothetical protein